MKDQFLVTSDHPAVRDHVVRGQHLLPGLAYIDLVYQFLRGAGHSFEEWELRDLSIYEPLVVSAGQSLVLTVESSGTTPDSLQVLIQSEEYGRPANSGKPRRHVIVQAHRVKPASFGEQLDLASIRSSSATLDVAQIYDHFRDLGLVHGEFMRVGGTVYVTDDAAYADVTLGTEALAAGTEMLFSPALLDGSAVCGSVGLARARAPGSRRLSLPIYFQSFRACKPLRESCIARLRFDTVRERNEVSYVTLDLFDSEGRKIAELRDLAGTSGLKTELPGTEPRATVRPGVEVRAQQVADNQQNAVALRIEQRLHGWLAERGFTRTGNLDTRISFAEMGLTSSELLTLLQDLETRIGMPLSPTLLFEYGNIQELAGYLAGVPGARFDEPELERDAAPGIPAGNAVLASDEAPANDPSARIEQFLRRQLVENGHAWAAQVDAATSFAEAGLDSYTLLQILQRLEAVVGIPLSPTLLFEYGNIKELAAHLATVHNAMVPIDSGADSHGHEDVAVATNVAVAPTTASAANAAQESVPAVAPTDCDVAIIGICGRFPGARSVPQLWDVLKSGRDCITEIPAERWDYRKYRYYEDHCRLGSQQFCHWGGFIDDVDEFDASFFNVQPLPASCMDPKERLFLQAAWELLENAGYTRERLKEEHGSRVGVYVGAMYHDYGHIEAELSQELGSFLAFHSSVANRVSHFLDLNGPSLALDTMCSSSAVAIHSACKDLRAGDCELAIVGGVNLSLHHKKFIGLSHGKFAGTDASSRSFSRSDGYLPAEAVGAVLLKPLARAIAGRDRILGIIKSTAVNHGGRTNGYGVPNPTAQALVIEECLAKAGVDPSTVSYVEATSNGSPLSDPLELVALHRAFSKHTSARRFCPIGTVKSNIGHAEAASAMTQLAKVLLQFEHRQLPPTIMAEPLNPLAQWTDTAFHLVHELQDWPQPTLTVDGEERRYPRRALLNSFGAGGTNACLLLEEYIEPAREAARPDEPAARRPQIIVLSATSADRLRVMLRRTHEHLQHHPQMSLQDIAYTLQIGREAMKVRLALVVRTREELASVLERSVRFELESEHAVPADLPLFFGDGTGTPTVRSLIDGRAGKAMIEMLLRDNDAERLAMLWTQGATIPWRLLHTNGNARSIPLPTYPFRPERHWLLPREASVESAVVAEPDGATIDDAPRPDAHCVGERITPRNDMERTVAAIWEEILEIQGIGVTDNFLELGGNSLQAGLVIRRCAERFEVDLDWRLLLGQEPTVAGLVMTIVTQLAQGVDERELEAALTN